MLPLAAVVTTLLTTSSPELQRPKIPCILHVPRGIGHDQKLPVIIYLHGKSLRGSNLSRLRRYGLPSRLQHDRSFPFIVICPQLSEGSRWTDPKELMSLVDYVLKKYPGDPNRVYAMGFSMGGSGVWRLADAYPKRFAAIVPIAGSVDEEVAASSRTKPVAVWAFHGSADHDVNWSNTSTMVKAHEKHGGETKFTLLPGEGHSILEVFGRTDVYKWLLQHQLKKPAVHSEPPAKDPESDPETAHSVDPPARTE